MDNYNAVSVEAHAAGPTHLIGQALARFPTASAVLADVIDIVSGGYQKTAQRFRFTARHRAPIW